MSDRDAERADPELRPATPADVASIAALWHDAWRDGHLGHVPEALLEHRRAEDFLARVPPRIERTTVATRGDAVVGFATLDADELEQLFVAAPARGGGIADALIEHAERTIGARFARAWLAVATGNARARRFYERRGWRDVGAIDYAAEVPGGSIPVPCRRYEKRLRPEPEPR